MNAGSETSDPALRHRGATKPGRLDQIAAMPLGARVLMDPWSNRLDLNRAPAVPLYWAREKLPLAITPMSPYLKYADAGVITSSR